MSQSQPSERTDELTDLFVSLTGDEAVTEKQETDTNDRELRGENRINEAVADGLDDAIEGAEANSGDPGG